MDDVNLFAKEGKLAQSGNARQVFENTLPAKVVPQKVPSSLNATGNANANILSGQLIPVLCVGESSSKPKTLTPKLTTSPTAGLPLKSITTVHSLDKVPPKTITPGSSLEEGEIPSQPLSGPPKSWSAIVSKTLRNAFLPLSFLPSDPISKDGSILVKPPVEVLRRGNLLWSSSLVGFFLSSKLPYKVFKPIASRLWGNLGLSKVFLHDKGYYIFNFNSLADRDNILATGPWHFASKVMTLQPWKAGVDFTKSEYSKIPIWVKLSNIPYSYWNAEGISYIACSIGKPLYAD